MIPPPVGRTGPRGTYDEEGRRAHGSAAPLGASAGRQPTATLSIITWWSEYTESATAHQRRVSLLKM
ncbi:hypothetical protein SMICM17S_12877 [Streptomyces microflavus]